LWTIVYPRCSVQVRVYPENMRELMAVDAVLPAYFARQVARQVRMATLPRPLPVAVLLELAVIEAARVQTVAMLAKGQRPTDTPASPLLAQLLASQAFLAYMPSTLARATEPSTIVSHASTLFPKYWGQAEPVLTEAYLALFLAQPGAGTEFFDCEIAQRWALLC
jgi:hypothetical protein